MMDGQMDDINMDDSYDEIGSSELNSVDMELLSKIENTETYREPLINKKTWAELCDTSDDEDDDWFEQNVANNKTLLKELEEDTNQTSNKTISDGCTIKQENKLLSISEEEDQNEDEELVNMMRKNMDETQFIDKIKKLSSAESRKRLSDVPLNRLTNFTGKPKKTKIEDLFRSVQQATTSNLSASAPSGRGFMDRSSYDCNKRTGRGRLRLSSFECKRNSRQQASSPTPSRLSSSSSMSTISFCNDPDVIQRRQKQIDYGKNTIGYQEYLKQIPKFKRSKDDPKTPNKNLNYSRRSWDQQIKLWRIKLHSFDPPEYQASSEDIDLTDIISCDILC